jgi:hypothetical protein
MDDIQRGAFLAVTVRGRARAWWECEETLV